MHTWLSLCRQSPHPSAPHPARLPRLPHPLHTPNPTPKFLLPTTCPSATPSAPPPHPHSPTPSAPQPARLSGPQHNMLGDAASQLQATLRILAAPASDLHPCPSPHTFAMSDCGRRALGLPGAPTQRLLV
eukprot:73024-Chlamydomonas_euryale.AAC.1